MTTLTSIVLLAAMTLTLVRALRGPTVFDRLLSVNSFSTLTVALMATYGFLEGRPEFLDIALVYALIGFVTVIAVVKFVSLRKPQE